MMTPFTAPLIPQQVLQNARRVLYMSHLAIGDMVFQGVYLQALKQRFPHIQLDIWLDDLRSRQKVWHKGRNETLNQWLESLDFVSEIYPICDSNQHRQELTARAKDAHYDVVFFIASQRTERFAQVARRIAPQGFVVGSRTHSRHHWLQKWWSFRRLDGSFALETADTTQHISQAYQQRFESCVGELFPDARTLRQMAIDVPPHYLQHARQWLDQQATEQHLSSPRVLLINHLSTNNRRDLSLHKLETVIQRLHQQTPNTLFVLNVPPNALESTREYIDRNATLAALPIVVFSATQHFFQLPALLLSSDMVLTVETAIMHLASTLEVPQVVLMRANASQWRPVNAAHILSAEKRVDELAVEQIVNACMTLHKQLNQVSK